MQEKPTRVSGNKPGSEFLVMFLLIAGLLAVLFHSSFIPGETVFSNDGPLGQRMSLSHRLPGTMLGGWQDLTSIGTREGTWPNVSNAIGLMLGPLGYSKFHCPLVLLILGLSAWFFFRQAGLTPMACWLGGLAAVMNSAFFSNACWGVGEQIVSLAMNFLALAALSSNLPRAAWLKYVLAGMAVGMGVLEGADIGAIYSVFIAAFVLYKSAVVEGPLVSGTARGVGRVAMVAVCAVLMAAHSLSVLVGTQVKDIGATTKDAETEAERWNFATQWSLPQKEILGLVIPGLFGYGMATPVNLPESLRDVYKGGTYWGSIGQHPSWDKYFADGGKSPMPDPGGGGFRSSGAGGYEGVVALLIAVWAGMQAMRKKDSVFQPLQRRVLWYWMGAAVLALLLAPGRHSPFASLYHFLYFHLPGTSYVRNPAKFVVIFNLAVVILFAHGVNGLNLRFLQVPFVAAAGFGARLRNWWLKAAAFDRRWVFGCFGAIVLSLLGWTIYGLSKDSLLEYLKKYAFGQYDPYAVASFSIHTVGWFVLFLLVAVGLMTLILAGVFAGPRARWAGIFLGIVLLVDLVRANLPWIVYVNYREKYATNPVIEFLRDKPYEHRVNLIGINFPQQLSLLRGMYDSEWMQHHFPYYDIQSLDIVQMPRMPEDLMAFEAVTRTSGMMTRRWELTNTRYILGPAVWPADQNHWAPFIDLLNHQFDPALQRFRMALRFALAPKPGLENATRLEEITAVPDATNGPYAVIDFTGALPRAQLYSNWRVATNDPATLPAWVKSVQEKVRKDLSNALGAQTPGDQATLQTLVSESFDPSQTVLLSEPLPVPPAAGTTNPHPGTVEFVSYAPRNIVLKAKADAPAVLLLNDRYHPYWRVTVDGKPADLLRCNFIMRGVYLTPGEHRVEFSFICPAGSFYVTLGVMVAGLLILGCLVGINVKQAAAARSGRAKNGPKHSASGKPARGGSA